MTVPFATALRKEPTSFIMLLLLSVVLLEALVVELELLLLPRLAIKFWIAELP